MVATTLATLRAQSRFEACHNTVGASDNWFGLRAPSARRKRSASTALTARTAAMLPASNSPTRNLLAHHLRDFFPARIRNVPCNAAIGNDFDSMVREFDVDQHAVVVFGIPDAKLGKHHFGALARRCIATQIAPRQSRFDCESNFARVHSLAFGDFIAEFAAAPPAETRDSPIAVS